MNQTAKFWDDIAEGYAKSKIRDPGAYEEKLKITRELFPAEANVLEIACGTGTTALHHAPHVKHYTATDISQKMLEIGREKAAAAGLSNISFEQQNILEARLPEAAYDAVLAMSILHLVADRPALLAKVVETLKPGGVFVSSTICLGNMAFYFPVLLSVMKRVGKAPSIVDSFKHEHLDELMQEAGLIIERHDRMSKGSVAFIVARKPN